jgi:deoxyribodipyrimidine photolyase
VRRWVTELADADDVTLSKGDRPAGYPEPIADHSVERSEALLPRHQPKVRHSAVADGTSRQTRR